MGNLRQFPSFILPLFGRIGRSLWLNVYWVYTPRTVLLEKFANETIRSQRSIVVCPYKKLIRYLPEHKLDTLVRLAYLHECEFRLVAVEAIFDVGRQLED